MVRTMETRWILVLVPFLSAAAGAYFGGYLKRKGENLATHEDMDKLLDQVSAVTKTTKGIETKISGDLWDRQKQWELKREILFEAAKRLSEIDNKLLSLRTFWRMKTKGELEGGTSQITLENQFVTEWQQAATSFEETETLVHVTCSKEAMTAFTELGNLMRSTASKIVHGDLEIYSQSEQERNKKFVMARVAIRKELGIKFDVTP
jgi:hypothetical protein